MELSIAYSKAIKYSINHDAIINKAVERWKNFVPTINISSPGRHFVEEKAFHKANEELGLIPTKDKFSSEDFHDASAILSGTKPAALLNPGIVNHPLGKRLLQRLREEGYPSIRVMHSNNPDTTSIAVGKPEHVATIASAYSDFSDIHERHRKLGEALGYPPEAIEEFITRWKKYHGELNK